MNPTNSKMRADKAHISNMAIFVIMFFTILLSVTGTLFFVRMQPAVIGQDKQEAEAKHDTEPLCNNSLFRLKGYNMVKPLLFSERECESERLNPIKGAVGNYVEEQKAAGNIADASVYVRTLSTAEYTSVNPTEVYHPGSLFKLPILIALLHQEEEHPGYWQQTMQFSGQGTAAIGQTFESESITPGRSYTLKELAESMIKNSDNYATQLLNGKLASSAILKVFDDLSLTIPPTDASFFNYALSAKDYSRFLLTIYNSSYISPKLSEYAAELLAQSTFKEGMVAQLPANIKVAHKFGEAGHGTEMQLHESGIVFLNDSPYLITIMTKGSDVKKQATVISGISKIVFDMLNKPAV